MDDESAARGRSHDLLLAFEARQVLKLHRMLLATFEDAELTWFIVDLDGAVGRFCGEQIVGPAVVAHRLAWAARNSVRPSMSFPLDGPDALLVVAHLAPDLVGVVHQRIAGDVVIIVIDQEDVAALAWLHELGPEPGST